MEVPAQSDVARSVHAYLDAHMDQMLALLEVLVGHCDTVWPLGTLAEVPFEVDGNVVRGPGVFGMKGGLVQMIFALAALRAARVEPMATSSVSMLRPSTGSGRSVPFWSVEKVRHLVTSLYSCTCRRRSSRSTFIRS